MLYGGGKGGGTLYSVNPQTGVLTTVGSGSPNYGPAASSTTGLFALDSSPNMDLSSINPSTGASTLMGPTGLSPSAIVEGVSAGSSVL